jgi:hypothetical protein|tara:strand:+ start:1520 stop:1801 length:282 start_codon:yes stop_codon:yes gene_type:complete
MWQLAAPYFIRAAHGRKQFLEVPLNFPPTMVQNNEFTLPGFDYNKLNTATAAMKTKPTEATTACNVTLSLLLKGTARRRYPKTILAKIDVRAI